MALRPYCGEIQIGGGCGVSPLARMCLLSLTLQYSPYPPYPIALFPRPTSHRRLHLPYHRRRVGINASASTPCHPLRDPISPHKTATATANSSLPYPLRRHVLRSHSSSTHHPHNPHYRLAYSTRKIKVQRGTYFGSRTLQLCCTSILA